MTRAVRSKLVLGLFGIAAIAVLAAWCWPRPRWNLLLVTFDTTRADHIGCYGHRQALTPVLDSLAERGVLFDRAYTPVPMTLPAHASLLTGLYPPEHGLRINGTGRLGTQIPTLAEMLRKEGYDTAAFIASFVLHSKFGLNRGFQEYDDDMAGGDGGLQEIQLSRNASLVVDAALSWLHRRRARPFFCWVHLYDPHSPFDAHAETFGDRFREEPYDGEIAFADQQLGRLVDFLKSRRLDERTLVVVVGDHGEGLGEHQEREHSLTLYNASLHVPLIIAGPRFCRAGIRAPSPVSLVDVGPTILDCLEVRSAAAVSGVSFRPALQGARVKPRLCYAETDAPFTAYRWAPLRSLTTEAWKYVKTTREELYDLRQDPQELHDLALSHPAQIAEMQQLLAGLEQRMVVREGSAVQLTESERRKLESLGYAAASHAPPPVDPGAALPDVKDMLVYYNAQGAAQELLNTGKFAEAEARLRDVVEAVPDFLPARLTLGGSLEKQNRADEALAVYEAALKLHPDNYDVHFSLAQLCAAQGKPDEAIAHYTAALKESPEFATARVNLANILVQQGKFDQALTHYEQALEDSPDSVVAHFNLGMVLAGQKNYAAGLPHVARAVQLNPAEADMQFGLGSVLAALGRFDDAVYHLELAVKLNPQHPRAASQLQRARAKLGRSD